MLYRKHNAASKPTLKILVKATSSAPRFEPADEAPPVTTACPSVVPEGGVALLIADVVDVIAVFVAAYKLISVLLPSTLEPPVLVPKSIVSVALHMVT